MSFYGNPNTINDVPDLKCYGCDFRTEFLTMWQCVNRLNLWDVIKNVNSSSNQASSILNSNYTEKSGKSVVDCGHSGATGSMCFYLVKDVALHGWNTFSERYA